MLLLLVACLTGCGKGGQQVAPVHGQVLLDGKPLVLADVTFQPEGAQRPSIGRTDSSGHYELVYKRGQSGAIVGAHTVRISVSSELVRNPPPIPARYDSQTELRQDVKPGENEFDFDLKSDGK